MARDISSIRTQALVREGKNIPAPKLHVQEKESISSLRSKELKKEGMPMLIDKAGTAKKLSEILKKKRIELSTTAEATKSMLTSAGTEADRIISEAKKKASELTTQAISDRETSKKLLNQAKVKEEELVALEKDVEQREVLLLGKEKRFESDRQSFKQKSQNVDKLLTTASKHKEQAVDIFVTAVALLQLCMETMIQVQNLNSEASEEVSQTLSKAGTIMSRVSVLIKNIDADRSILSERATELQNWQIGLVDRENMLLRTARELNQKAQK